MGGSGAAGEKAREEPNGVDPLRGFTRKTRRAGEGLRALRCWVPDPGRVKAAPCAREARPGGITKGGTPHRTARPSFATEGDDRPEA
jgi:hypothetical protein